DGGLLGLDEISHVDVGAKVGPRAKVRKGTDDGFFADHRFGGHTVWFDLHARTDVGVGQHDAVVDARPGAHARTAAQRNVAAQLDVFAQLNVGLDGGRRW